MRITYNQEYPRRMRVAAIGCGGHAFRNVFPTFQYAPVDFVAACDLRREAAEHVARLFGAPEVFTDYRDMLARTQPEAVIVVTDYDERGHPRYPAIVPDILRAGAHAWIEKPPAATEDEVRAMMAARDETGKHVMVGFKKMFFPANTKAKELMQRPEFGALTSITARYPQHLPDPNDRSDDRKMIGFLDHMVHPHSVLQLFAGPTHSIYVQRHASGGAIVAIRFKSGAVGSLHYSHGQSGVSFFERTELVGEGANIVVDNNLRVTFYPAAAPQGGYGRAGSYYDTGNAAPSTWEPEFSLGNLYNKGIFLLGYAIEIMAFCRCVLDSQPPKLGSLEDALEIVKIYDAYRRPDGQEHVIPAA